MGHERLGLLPKTRRWRDVVQQLASLYTADTDVSDVARNTISLVRSRLRHIADDSGVRESFKFLLLISVSARSPAFLATLSQYGITVPDNPSLLSLAKALKDWVGPNQQSLEYGQLAVLAASDALADWYDAHKGQQDLFHSFHDSLRVWQQAGNEGAFCEISRIYFAKYVERYLNYFLEREASAQFGDIALRDQFKTDLQNHIDQLSRHAFETAKITQSFAAGWYRKNAEQSFPDNKSVQGFLHIAFGKLRDELMREEVES